jgi:hypothetical protein
MTVLSEGRVMDWPSTLPPCPILRGVIERVAAAGADHVERVWCEMDKDAAKCDICRKPVVWPSHYGDWECPHCHQPYEYDEGLKITLNDAQLALLRNPPRWIPVGERLPEDNVDVLVRRKTDCGMRSVAAYRSSGRDCWTITDGDYSEFYDHSVTHWMPLPGPTPE